MNFDLRSVVLQAAIQGNLTDQRPEDGTAEELLEQIHAEKKRLIAEGKIKREKALPTITEDEKPFDIPESWTWERWGNISFSIQYGYNAPALRKGPARMVRISDIQNNEIQWSTVPYCEISNNEIQNYTLAKNDILFARTGGTVGKSYLVNEVPENTIYAGYLIRTRFSHKISPQYIKFFMGSNLYWQQLRKGTTATAQPNCNGKTLSAMIVPLPPLAEQERIVERVEALMSKIDAFEEADNKLEELKKKFPEDLRDALLQAAIQGKLTDQKLEDGTAEELLEQIRAEKKRLIAEGKIKKEKVLPPISKEEIPFDIPDNWCWVRLGEISTYGKSTAKIKAKNINKDAWILDLEDIEKGGRIIKQRKAEELKSKGDKTVFYQDDILYSKLRPYLLKILLAPSEGFCTTELVPFRCYGKINHEYIINFLKSSYTDNTVNKATYGIKMPRVGKDTMLNLLVPLPPLAEQERIVEHLNELLPLCERMR